MPTIIDGSLGITFPVVAGGTSAVQASSGKVLQVVQASSSGGSTTSSTFVDMGLSASITPSSSSSKIFVSINGYYRINAGQRAGFAIVRGSTTIWSGTELCGFQGTITYSSGSYYMQYLDSPATTSSTTYKVQFLTNGSPSVFYTNDIGSGSATWNFITLMEIAA